MKKPNRLRMIVSGIAVVGTIAVGGYLYCGDAPRLKRGIAHFEDGAYSKAYDLLHPLAKKGYAEAQLRVGDCLATGRGVLFEDEKEAVKWYRAAADLGLAEAQHRLFMCYRDGIGCERNRTNAAKWCRKAAEAGLDEAMYDMGLLYLSGIGVRANAKSAYKWFHRSAELGELRAIYMVGVCYRTGTGVEQDEDEAARWQNKALESWRQLANAGDVNAMLQLARLAENEDCDKEEAAKWYRKAAENGNATAQFKLALCYSRGEGVEEDGEVAAQWMLKAAEQGAAAEAQWYMGRFYQDGKGVELNPTEAVKWFARSAKKNWPRAKHSLALCYWRGDGIQKDEAKAERLLEEAAESGNADASDDLRRIRAERAQKERKIETLLEIESDILVRKERINNILKGKMNGDWDGFNATKARTTDVTISVAEELPQTRRSASISENSEMQAIDDALVSAQKEAERLEAREKELARVKDAYNAKELESRKVTCASCDGAGSTICSRCKGKGQVIVKERTPCPTCAESADGLAERKGQILKKTVCQVCRGKGETQPKCAACSGSGRLRIRYVRGGSLRQQSAFATCNICGGSGKADYRTCVKCSGEGKVNVWKTCKTCQGRGEVMRDTETDCPNCNGETRLECIQCNGNGFTYKPKQ